MIAPGKQGLGFGKYSHCYKIMRFGWQPKSDAGLALPGWQPIRLRSGQALCSPVILFDQPFDGTGGGGSSGAMYVPIDRNNVSLEFA